MCTSHDVEDNTQNGDPRSGYVLAEDWPRYPPEMHFEMGSGVAVDEHGIIYLFTRDLEHWAAHPLAMSAKMGKSTVSMFNRDGDYLGKWGHSDEPGFALGAHTIHIEKDGFFWTTDRDGHTVRKFTPEGEMLLQLGTFAEWGCDESHFNGPTAVVVQDDGTIVVDEWTHIMPLSLATYGNRIYASDKMSNLAILDEDSGRVLSRVDNIAIYIHQLAMDAHGDLYTASVYPERAGEARGPTGPSHRRWTRSANG
ncbi:MAG: hypothetical protein OXJ53_09960 [Gammaproteobacteria bacterium]|nr:hypothetical protein [Gammaproteobacteria bacterium]MDE0272702.1 hypothetical protein [Gammaproteobacteria bacterium]